jgi:NADPH:quinone reductase-like Zn-dependent oxidoreductase
MTGGLILRGRYSGPEKFEVVRIDVPEIGDDDVLVR